MNQNNQLGVLTISGKFRILGFLKASWCFLKLAIKEAFNNAIKFERETGDLYYSVNAKLEIKQIKG